MAKFYDVRVVWRDGSETNGRAIGNNAAWLCRCNEVLLGPYRYAIPPCPKCGKQFQVFRGEPPQFVDRVVQVK